MTAQSTDSDLVPAIRRVLRRVGDGLVPPRDGMRALVDVVIGHEQLHEASAHTLGDAWGIEALVGAYYQYLDIDNEPEIGWGPDALSGDAARAYLDRQIVSEAFEWVQARSA